MSDTRILSDLSLMYPDLLALFVAVLALVAEIAHKPRWSLGITVVGLTGAGALAISLLGKDTSVFMGTWRVDVLAVWAKIILLPATALTAVLAVPEARGTDREGTVYTLLAFTSLGAVVLSAAGDVMFIVLGVLMSSLGSFALVSYPRNNRATEAGMKYFVFGSVSEAVMIFGLTYWFGATGSTLLSNLSVLDASQKLPAIAGLVGVLVGLGYKAALVPFHFWAPDGYDGGPVSVAAFLSVVPKIGAIFGLAQVASNLPEAAVQWRMLVAMVAVATMTFGNVAALVQNNVVRLLAYSSIAQSGYFLLGIVALGKSRLAVESLIVFAAAYAVMNLGAFAVVLRMGRDIESFTGTARTAVWMGVGTAVFLFSLVGIPPLAGFFGKLLLFSAAVDIGYTWLAVVAIINSVLSLAVYLRIIAPMYQQPRKVSAASMPVALVGTVAFVLTLGIGIAAQALLRFLE